MSGLDRLVHRTGYQRSLEIIVLSPHENWMPGAYGEGEEDDDDDDAAAYYAIVVEAANYSSCAAGR